MTIVSARRYFSVDMRQDQRPSGGWVLAAVFHLPLLGLLFAAVATAFFATLGGIPLSIAYRGERDARASIAGEGGRAPAIT